MGVGWMGSSAYCPVGKRFFLRYYYLTASQSSICLGVLSDQPNPPSLLCCFIPLSLGLSPFLWVVLARPCWGGSYSSSSWEIGGPQNSQESFREFVKMQIPRLCPKRFLLRRSGVKPKDLHYQQAPGGSEQEARGHIDCSSRKLLEGQQARQTPSAAFFLSVHCRC